MTSYQSKYKETNADHSDEDRFMDDMETSHKEIFDNLKMAREGKLDHRDAPWNIENHKNINYTSQDESSYEYRLNPESAAGKIFNSLSEFRSQAKYHEKDLAAIRLAHNMTTPVAHAISEFQDPDAPPKDSIPSMAEEFDKRMTIVHQEVYAALSYDDEDEFISALTGLQHLSHDAHLLKTVPGYDPSFIDSLRDLDPELANELRAIKTQDGNDPAPSWLDSEHAIQSRDEIYNVINNREIPHDGTGHSTAAYYRTAINDVAEHISQPVLNQINAFKNDHTDDNQENTSHAPLVDYLTDRLNSIEKLTQYGLFKQDREIYNQAMENLIRLNGEAQLIRSGETPQEDWNDGTRFNEDNIAKLAEARAAAKNNQTS